MPGCNFIKVCVIDQNWPFRLPTVPFMVLGSFILFMGFLAFNGGCILKIVSVDEGVAEEEHGPALALSAGLT